MGEVQSRLMDFIRSKKISISDFERISNLSTGYVYKIKNTVGKRALWDIQRAFPDLNTSWLLTGEGDMLSPSVVQNNQIGNNILGNSVRVTNADAELISHLRKEIELKDKILEEKERLINVLMKGRR